MARWPRSSLAAQNHQFGGPVYAPGLTIDLPSRSAEAGLERVVCPLPGIMEWQNVPGGNPACCAEGELR